MLSRIIVTAIVVATTVMLFGIVGHITRTALRTGRWLGQGVVYDRTATPIRFRLALGSERSSCWLSWHSRQPS